MSGTRNGNTRFLSPRVIQATGILLLIGSVAVWIFTNRQSALMVSASLSMILLGSYQNAVTAMRGAIEQATASQNGGEANGK